MGLFWLNEGLGLAGEELWGGSGMCGKPETLNPND